MSSLYWYLVSRRHGDGAGAAQWDTVSLSAEPEAWGIPYWYLKSLQGSVLVLLFWTKAADLLQDTELILLSAKESSRRIKTRKMPWYFGAYVNIPII